MSRAANAPLRAVCQALQSEPVAKASSLAQIAAPRSMSTLVFCVSLCFFQTRENCLAVEGVWTNASVGSWSEPANWSVVPHQAGDISVFRGASNADARISIEQPITIGQLRYAQTHNTTFGGLGPLILDNLNEAASIENEGRLPGYVNLAIPIQLRSDLDVINRSQTRIDLSGGVTSAEGIDTDLHLRAESRGGFQLLGGLNLNGDLSISGSAKAFLAGELQFHNLLLNQAEATFESPFSAELIELGDGSKLVVEQPSTVKNLRLAGGTVQGIDRLSVTEATIATEGIVDFAGSGGLFDSAIIKEGPERFSAVHLSNDFQKGIFVRDGWLLLEYPTVGAIAPGKATGAIHLDGPSARLSILSNLQGPPLSFSIDLNNVQPKSRFESVLDGNAHLTGAIDLGDKGSQIQGGFRLSGPISGGSLTLNGYIEIPDNNHTFTGDTIVTGGSLVLLNDGALTTTSSIVIRQGELVLQPTHVAQRVGEAVPIILERGTIEISELGPVTQQLGDILVPGRSSIIAASGLQIRSLDVAPDASLRINAGFEQGPILVAGFAETDLLPANIRHQRQFARYDSELGVLPLLPAFEFQPDSWNEASHAAVHDRITLSHDATVRTLSLQPDGQEVSQLTITDGTNLNILSGGIHFAESGRINGSGGSLTAGGSADAFLYLISQGEIQFDAPITDNAGPDGDFATVDDNGAVGLLVDSSVITSGDNTYSGPTVVMGDLQYVRQAAISQNSDVVIRGGGVRFGFSGTARFKSITIEEQGSINNGEAKLQAELLTLKSGAAATVTGDTLVVKETTGESGLSVDSEFSGTVDLREGTLGLEFFRPPGATFGDHQATIRTAAGSQLELRSDAMNGAFEGEGSINRLTTLAGSVLRPGLDNTIGTLDIGEIHVRSGGTYQWQLGDAMGTPGKGWDHLQLGLLATAASSSPWKVQIDTLDIEGKAVQPQNFDNRRVYSWELASLEIPDQSYLDFTKLEVDALALAPSRPLPNAFSFALVENSWRLEYGRTADVNGDEVIDGKDLDAACDIGRDMTDFLQDQFGTQFGDVDLNGSVGFEDFLILSANFGNAGGWDAGDMTCGHQVDFADFLVFAQNFSAVGVTASVPEPTGWLYLLVGLLGWLVGDVRIRARRASK